MGIFVGFLGHILIALIHLVFIALDVTLFFLLVRCLANRWPAVAFFTTFDHIGSLLVEPLLRTLLPWGGSYRSRLLAVSLAFTVVRFATVAIVNSLIVGIQ